MNELMKIGEKCMNKQSKFAVVDMETTGTDVNNGDSIIQFSCTFIQNKQIIDNYSTFVYCDQNISDDITKLTGITNEKIQNAPSFDSLAAEIYKLLKNCIFVAHNVNFDFPFLNAELERFGYPKLENEAIDTVSLSQIFFPTFESYQLKKLSENFGINHFHPHSSESDAKATASIFIEIINKIEEVPLITLEQLLKLDLHLPMETERFIKMIFKDQKNNPGNLKNDLIIKNNLALKKLNDNKKIYIENKNFKFPKTKKQKEKFFDDSFSWRESQIKMMNSIDRNLNSDNPKNLIIEAPTGIGKTLGYLLPLTTALNTNRKVIISTSNITLQSQISDYIRNYYQKLLPFDINVSIQKGINHYLDLNRFQESLKIIEKSQQKQFLKAQILIWILSTETGDFSELKLPKNVPFLDEIKSFNVKNKKISNYFDEYDYNFRKRQELKYADFVILNHSYLYSNSKKLSEYFDKKPYLIIDEAHQLNNVILEQGRKAKNLNNLKSINGRMNNDIFQHHEHHLKNVILDDDDLNLVNKIIYNANNIRKTYEDMINSILNTINIRKNSSDKIILDTNETKNQLSNNTSNFNKIDLSFKKIFVDFLKLNNKIKHEQNKWSKKEIFIIKQFIEHTKDFMNELQSLDKIKFSIINNPENNIFWLQSKSEKFDLSHLDLVGGSISLKDIIQNNIYKYYENITFTSATMFTSKKSQFIFDQLDLNRDTSRMLKLNDGYDYSDKMKLFVANDSPENKLESNEKYIEYLATNIANIHNKNQYPTIVLFNSLKLIEKVTNYIFENQLLKSENLITPSSNGSNYKLLNRFLENKDAILFGSNRFWEGFNIPKGTLKNIIIPRLPFDSPNNPFISAQFNLIKKNKKNPFYNLSLPKAIIRLKQGIGRLIRDDSDFGTVILLDNRVITKKYGKMILNSLPKTMFVKDINTKDIENEVECFFNKKNKENSKNV
ncbi:DEAD/DEAH box helicase [Lactobacillus sp. S2-2]|uniref:helicase C-terminal domain-containing protein n=1 Tax=Lactobacillus sp. S2-2 TaxID=2692917 RepID=UPI001F01A13B|nr:helicase C-terminal domain-containing protein [Lactobacillus sp. S2-2]MCF6515072.1 DEAD/DEAH box helicase [Lactobacillus sp. S2-2]